MESQPSEAGRAVVLTEGTSETIAAAVDVLGNSGVIAVPTDTVFGLVCLYDNDRAIERIFSIKGRHQDKPLPLLLGTATELPLVAKKIPESIWSLIYKFWPGALTIVLEAHDLVSKRITAGSGTVGVRVPAHGAVLDTLEAVRFPLASTSANISGKPPLTNVAEVVEVFGNSVDMVIAPKQSAADGLPSTVVDLTTDPYLIRRRGAITPAEIRRALAARVEIAPEALALP